MIARPDVDSLAEIPLIIAVHLTAATLAIVIGARQLIRRKGDRRHRFWGRLWTAAMVVAALSSFAIVEINDGRLSVIHILSVWAVMALAMALLALHRRRRITDPKSREKYLHRHHAIYLNSKRAFRIETKVFMC